MQYTIYYPFTYLNEYIAAERTSRYKAAKIKRDTTFYIQMVFNGKPKIKTPCKMIFTHLVKNKRRDLDNLSIVTKYICDGMIKAGVITNDNLNHITEIVHKYEISDKVGVIVEVIE